MAVVIISRRRNFFCLFSGCGKLADACAVGYCQLRMIIVIVVVGDVAAAAAVPQQRLNGVLEIIRYFNAIHVLLCCC